MPNFESPISNRKFKGQPMRDLEIPDESGPPPAPTGGGQYAPSVTRRYGTPMSDQDMQEFQQRMEANADPDLNLSDIERDIKRQRQEKMHGQQVLNDGARRRIEMLIGMTRHSRTADIDGNAYVLQTLKGKEMREAILAASEFDGTVQSPFEIRKQLLARSLIQVAGVPFGQFAGSERIEAKFEVLDEMDDVLLNRLLGEYTTMVEEAKNKYAIKTVEEVKEIVEDLKK